MSGVTLEGFAAWQATGRDVFDLGDNAGHNSGRRYDAGTYIIRANDVEWILPLCDTSHASEDLESLEHMLYEYLVGEGYEGVEIDTRAAADTLDTDALHALVAVYSDRVAPARDRMMQAIDDYARVLADHTRALEAFEYLESKKGDNGS